MTWEETFSADEIYRVIARLRVRAAGKRHDEEFFWRMSTAARAPNTQSNAVRAGAQLRIEDITPPRSKWRRPDKELRKKLGAERVAEWSIVQTMRLTAAMPVKPRWFVLLAQVVGMVRYHAFNASSYKMGTPRIIAVAKAKGDKYYRPLAMYALIDRLVSGLAAKYLRTKLDPAFCSNSYAFRAGPRPPTHHNAVSDLRQFRKRFPPSDPIWVVECDISAFYDCVNHDVCRRSLQTALDRLPDGTVIDRRAILVFETYLASYAFEDARSQSQAFLASRTPVGELKWPTISLQALYGRLDGHRIGVPQGGAISCLIANLVLDQADRAVLQQTQASKGDLFYARYCDDMVVAHSSRAVVEAAAVAYQQALADLLLPMHPLKSVAPYTVPDRRAFWGKDAKSKGPYAWSTDRASGAVPWLSFLGYQCGADGRIRVRPRSMAKEFEKQAAVAGHVLAVVRGQGTSFHAGVRLSKQQIVHRLLQRMIAMSAGRAEGRTTFWPSATYCWAVGFELLRSEPLMRQQMRRLDRGRQRHIARVRKFVQPLGVTATSTKPPSGALLRFYGYPFSYAAAVQVRMASTVVPAVQTAPTGGGTAASTTASFLRSPPTTGSWHELVPLGGSRSGER